MKKNTVKVKPENKKRPSEGKHRVWDNAVKEKEQNSKGKYELPKTEETGGF